MTPKEIDAFISAYSVCVGDADTQTVTDFMNKYNAGEYMDYFEHYTSIMDALMMWHSAIQFVNSNK